MSIIHGTDEMQRIEGRTNINWLYAFFAVIFVILAFSVPANAQTRSLKLYFVHTKERAEITYMRNGRFDSNGLQKINRFLRDWRRNEPTKMDPKVIDLLWQVYNAVGARDYIHVVSAYRSPATNKMLRSRSSGVAKESQHMLGKAIDFYIPGVPLSKLRAAAFKAESGGVGYYPRSGSPFVHIDVAGVRSWPRMSRTELSALFPNGKTMHLPSDGKPMPGYKQALAAYKERQRSGTSVQLAGASSSDSGSRGGLLATLFGGGRKNEAKEPAPVRAAAPAIAVASAPAVPVRERPETVIAALPERSVPLPGTAPRPEADVGAPVVASLAVEPSSQLQETTPVAVVPVEVALNIPVPSRRPDYSPVVAALDVNGTGTVDLPINAIAPQRSPGTGSDVISQMLAANAGAKNIVDDTLPVPSLRPQLANDVDTTRFAVARVDNGSPDEGFVLASLSPDQAKQLEELKAAIRPDVFPEALARKPLREASLPATPREAVLKRTTGSDVVAALDSGVRTTPKSSRPYSQKGARSVVDPVVVPIDEETVRWAFTRNVVAPPANQQNAKPEQAYETVFSSPKTIYTDGFSADARVADAHRFTGNAVTFMSIARFNEN